MTFEVHMMPGATWAELEQAHLQAQDTVLRREQEAILLVAEPTPTFTAGFSAKRSDLLWDDQTLQLNAVATAQVGRGGSWTYHGPGQIVVYPVVRLESLGLNARAVREYLGRLRNAVQHTAHAFGIDTVAGEAPFGVYVQGRKLCSFGIAVKRGISSHGLAFYHRRQTAFSGINPCGVAGAQSTSFEELGVTANWGTVAAQLVESIKKGLKSPETQIA